MMSGASNVWRNNLLGSFLFSLLCLKSSTWRCLQSGTLCQSLFRLMGNKTRSTSDVCVNKQDLDCLPFDLACSSFSWGGLWNILLYTTTHAFERKHDTSNVGKKPWLLSLEASLIEKVCLTLLLIPENRLGVCLLYYLGLADSNVFEIETRN